VCIALQSKAGITVGTAVQFKEKVAAQIGSEVALAVAS
jgi:hypothetical protein